MGSAVMDMCGLLVRVHLTVAPGPVAGLSSRSQVKRGVRYRVLGSLEVTGPDGPVVLRSASQRLLLTLLLAADGAFVSPDRLADDLWGEDQPGDPAGALQTHVSRLRRLLPDPAALETGPAGYRLVDPDDSDRHRFAALVAAAADARREADPAAALAGLDDALGLWRGQAFADVADHPSVEALAAGLDDARARAEEDRVEVLLDLGDHATAATAADGLRRASPLRERPAALAMRALYAGGRHAEALAAYADLRRALGDELGLEPSDELRELEGRILRHELDATPVLAPAPAPARAAVFTPRQVPRPRTRIIGREVDLGRIADALAGSRLATLIGPGGTGKTRLALEVSGTASDAAFVDLTRIDPGDDLAIGVAGQLGIDQRSGQSPTERLVEALHTHDLLVVLDNCEHVLDDAAALADELLGSTSGVRILATSREALAIDGEQVVAIEPLDTGSAADLLVERAESAGVTLDRDRRALQLCALVDHLPLGVELVAARLRGSSLDELLTALTEERDALDGGRRTAAERHRSLDALVAWSYDDLDGADQEVLRALAVFAGPARSEDVAAVLGRPAAPGLRRLVECSLAVRREREGISRFGLLETVRQFGRRRLAEQGDLERLRAAHAAWAVGLAEAVRDALIAGEGLAALHHLDDALDDVRQSFRAFVEAGDRAGARRLVAPLWSYNLSRVNSEVYGWARELDDRWPVSGADPDPDGTRVAGLAATGDAMRGALADGLDRAQRAVQAGGGGGPRALAHGGLAVVQLFRGDPVAAAESYREAQELSDAAGEAAASTFAWAEVAQALHYAERPEAKDLADRAVADLRERGDPAALSFALYVAGEVRLTDDPEAARAFLEEALAAARIGGDRLTTGAAGVSLLSLTSRRDPRAALADFPDLLDHWLRTGLWSQLWTTMRLVIEALAATGDERAAARLLGAHDASERSAAPYGADERRLADLRARLEAALGHDELAALLADGRTLDDDEAVDEALGAVARAYTS
jgi:predicted ATPase/DNA-binding SARP family transcriptional activator